MVGNRLALRFNLAGVIKVFGICPRAICPLSSLKLEAPPPPDPPPEPPPPSTVLSTKDVASETVKGVIVSAYIA